MLSGIGGEGVNFDKSPAERAQGRKPGKELEAVQLLRKRDAVEPTRRGCSREGAGGSGAVEQSRKLKPEMQV